MEESICMMVTASFLALFVGLLGIGLFPNEDLPYAVASFGFVFGLIGLAMRMAGLDEEDT